MVQLEAGDVVLSYDDKRVNTIHDLAYYVRQTKPGTDVTLLTWRGGTSREVIVTIGAVSGADTLLIMTSQQSEPQDFSTIELSLGLVLRALDDSLRLRYDNDESIYGVLFLRREARLFSGSVRYARRRSNFVLVWS